MWAVKALETSTRWSPECCILLLKVGATSILFGLIRTCNRSLPHKELLQVSLRTLLNVCHHCGWDESCPDGAGACVDLVQIFRDKPEIFIPAVKLLHIAVASSEYARDWCGTLENLKRLKNVHALCARKQPKGSSFSDKAVRKAIKTLLHVVYLVSSD
jgi:abnormal spindle-like microcephaly-associated protein